MLLLSLAMSLCSMHISYAHLTLISKRTEPYSAISFVQDAKNVKYVIKQVPNTAIKEQCSLIIDCLCAEIALHINIQCNHVNIIPAYTEHVGKEWNNLPATIHSFAPGYSCDQDSCAYNMLDIQQRCRPIGSYTWKNHGMLLPQRRGLHRTAIKHMSLHQQLPSLVAFDTYIGNNDRGIQNLFYEKNSDTFCGIDMGNAYKQNLCKEAIIQLLRLSNSDSEFSPLEIKALGIYADTLKKLIREFPPTIIHARLMKLIDLSNLSSLDDHANTLQECILFYKDMITECYQDAQVLVYVLESFLRKISI